MTTKIYNICASTGKFTDNNGKTKNRYVRVGSVLKGDYGAYIMLDAHFNPAGIPRKDGSSSIILSLFPPKDSDTNNSGYSPAQDYGNPDFYPQDVPDPKQWNTDEPDSAIPF